MLGFNKLVPSQQQGFSLQGMIAMVLAFGIQSVAPSLTAQAAEIASNIAVAVFSLGTLLGGLGITPKTKS